MPQLSPSVSGDGRIRVRHREYLCDVLGSVNFAITGYAVNPGLGGSFPWLSPIANQFESYLFKNLTFEFETQKSASTSGTVMLTMDFDAADAAPVNKTQFKSYNGSVRSAVWDECCFHAPSANLQKFGVQRYVRSGALGANLDIKTYDVGNLFVATQGCADATAIGELYVVYDVELITPQSDVAGEALSESARVVGAGTVNLANCYGTVSGTITGGLPLTAVGGTLTFNRVGNYILEQRVVGTVLATAATVTGTATNGILYVIPDAAATSMLVSYLVKINNVGETLIFDYTGHATTVSATTTRIGSYNYALG